MVSAPQLRRERLGGMKTSPLSPETRRRMDALFDALDRADAERMLVDPVGATSAWRCLTRQCSRPARTFQRKA